MAIDTRNKRASAAGVALPFLTQYPLPDGTISGDDFQHSGFAYRGIAADAPGSAKATTHVTTLGEHGYMKVPRPAGTYIKDPNADRIKDCYTYKTLISFRNTFDVPITMVLDYETDIDVPGDFKVCMGFRNTFDVPINTDTDLDTNIGC